MSDRNDAGDDDGKELFTIHFLAGPNGPAFLSARLSNGDEVHVPLESRHARLIWILKQARDEDRDLAPMIAGWRTRQQVAEKIDRLSGYPVYTSTVTSYTSQLTRKLARAIEDVCPGQPASLIERRRNLGLRLAGEIELRLGPTTSPRN